MEQKNIPITGHYLFDFDGTLVDSMPYWAESMLRVLDNHGVSYPTDIIRTITPLGLIGTARHFISLGLDMPEDKILEEMASYLTPVYCDVVPEKPFVRECLTMMREKGIGLHVLTASPHRWLDPCLLRLGMLDLFDNVWSCDDFGTGKTDPEIYRAAARRIGAPISDVTFLDDNIGADRTAKSTGMPVIAVYDLSSASDEAAMRDLADAYIMSFAQLKSAIEGK